MATPAEKLHNTWFNKFKPKLAFWYADDKLFEYRGKLIMQEHSRGGYFEFISTALSANTRLASVITAIYLEENIPAYSADPNSVVLEAIALILSRMDEEMGKDWLVNSLGENLDFCNDLNVILDILGHSSHYFVRDILESN
jgi:hypothetical protein